MVRYLRAHQKVPVVTLAARLRQKPRKRHISLELTVAVLQNKKQNTVQIEQTEEKERSNLKYRYGCTDTYFVFVYMKFHPLNTHIELPRKFTYPFCYKPHAICIEAAEQLKAHITSDETLRKIAEQGKMFGVLVVKNKEGQLGFLAAYSGTTCFDFDNDYFVPPVFDYLQEDGFFKIGEREISEINNRIYDIEHGENISNLKKISEAVKQTAAEEIETYRVTVEEAKIARDAKRRKGCTAEEDEQMKEESRFMKAQLKRLKAKKEEEITKASENYIQLTNLLSQLKRERKEKSDALQEKLFRSFEMLDKEGNRKDVCDIFEEQKAGIPPSGTGECCAPKMIQYAFANNYTLVAMAEFWYGKTPAAEIRHHLHYYPSCMGKCKPLLTYMLHGIEMDENPLEHEVEDKLNIVYEDEYLYIIDKPSGMPTVDGKIQTKSAESIMKSMFPEQYIKAVHRLDMDTSGIVVFAKDETTYIEMQKLFADRKVKKRYTAILDREISSKNGRISLPLSPDYINRPMQMVDLKEGKPAITSYRVIEAKEGLTRISLIPITGRTHQLRVHCAHKDGLSAPILGDNLYGEPSERLFLHASYIEFVHPMTGEKISLKSNPSF